MYNIENIIKIFKRLSENLNNSNEIQNEMSLLIKDNLNEVFGEKIKCNRVFISQGNGTDPYFISVIPKKPASKILKTKFLEEYDIDIDLSSFISNYNKKGLTAKEMVAWLLHELFANVLTDDTLIRFKKLIVKYYDTKESTILDTIDTYGMMLWIGVFSRTRKIFSKDDTTDKVTILLKQYDISDDWDSALTKYISSMGGDISKLTEEYTNNMDKIQLRKFNELARKYSSYSLKYNNAEYSTMINYLINTTKSELIKHYLSKEPTSVPVHPEKMVYVLFDDTKILYESVGEESSEVDLYKEINASQILKNMELLKQEVNNIESESDKLLAIAKLKELSRLVDSKYEDASNESKELYQKIKYDTEELIDIIKNKEVSEHVSIQEIE